MNETEAGRALEVQVARLAASFDAFRVESDRRWTDHNATQREQHSENSQRLGRIEDQTRKTNGTVARHEQLLETHNEQIIVLFERTHAAAAAMGVHVPPAAPQAKVEDDAKTWTRRDAYMIAMGFAACGALYKFVVFVSAAAGAASVAPK